MRAAALATLCVAVAWNLNEADLLTLVTGDGFIRYRLYCSTLAKKIPKNSSILLAAIPDPYSYMLGQDKSYRIYEFVPEGVPVDDAEARETIAHVDDVVGSDCCRPPYLADYLVAHGKVELNMGSRDFLSPAVVVWKLSGSPDASAAGRQKAAHAR
jgi:hypothetical protein